MALIILTLLVAIQLPLTIFALFMLYPNPPRYSLDEVRDLVITAHAEGMIVGLTLGDLLDEED